MYRSSPLRSTLNTNVITGLGMCKVCTEAVHCVALLTRTLSQFGHVQSMYGSSPLRSTLNTNIITGSGMCKVCTGTRGKGVVTGSPTLKYYTGWVPVITPDSSQQKFWSTSKSQGSQSARRYPVGKQCPWI